MKIDEPSFESRDHPAAILALGEGLTDPMAGDVDFCFQRNNWRTASLCLQTHSFRSKRIFQNTLIIKLTSLTLVFSKEWASGAIRESSNAQSSGMQPVPMMGVEINSAAPSSPEQLPLQNESYSNIPITNARLFFRAMTLILSRCTMSSTSSTPVV
jgi:hypothetical protein